MNFTKRTLWWLPILSVLLSSAVAVNTAVGQSHAHRGYCVEGQCYPNPMYFGYYPTQWRRWPSAQPQMPTPADDQVAPPRHFPAGDVPDPLDEAAPNPSRRDRDGRLFRPRHPDELPGGTSRDPLMNGRYRYPDPRTDIRMPGSTSRHLTEFQRKDPRYDVRPASFQVPNVRSETDYRTRQPVAGVNNLDSANPLRHSELEPAILPPNPTPKPTDDGYLPLPCRKRIASRHLVPTIRYGSTTDRAIDAVDFSFPQPTIDR